MTTKLRIKEKIGSPSIEKDIPISFTLRGQVAVPIYLEREREREREND